jgi:D-tyrosyl-tRNA(Tyr) deacylase
MRLVVQRVSRASVTVAGQMSGSIGAGVVLLVGIEPSDTFEDVERAVEKVAGLRIFPDEQGLMNRSLLETGGSALVVSQFTLLGDVRKGRRPSFTGAAAAETARLLIDHLVDSMRKAGVDTATGVFGALMEVELVNHGPVTIVFDVRGASVI